MLILDQQNLDLKRLINIQKCHSSSKFDHCALRALGSEYLRSFLYKYESKPFGFLSASEGAISVKRND